mmetsp:Transcript_14144/g.61672  ORF Transcript_14144/g.61672 Transcript_14144/m.61672 type:complete len:219 (+) Transcript_14144:427-1083(+)
MHATPGEGGQIHRPQFRSTRRVDSTRQALETRLLLRRRHGGRRFEPRVRRKLIHLLRRQANRRGRDERHWRVCPRLRVERRRGLETHGQSRRRNGRGFEQRDRAVRRRETPRGGRYERNSFLHVRVSLEREDRRVGSARQYPRVYIRSKRRREVRVRRLALTRWLEAGRGRAGRLGLYPSVQVGRREGVVVADGRRHRRTFGGLGARSRRRRERLPRR